MGGGRGLCHSERILSIKQTQGTENIQNATAKLKNINNEHTLYVYAAVGFFRNHHLPFLPDVGQRLQRGIVSRRRQLTSPEQHITVAACCS